jgi:hypothetical protein
MSRLWIPKQLPSYTNLVELACSPKAGPARYASLKRSAEDFVKAHARKCRFQAEGRAWTYLFLAPNERTDPSNIISGGIKVIEDALRGLKIIPNDGWRDVAYIRPYFVVSRKMPGVLVWSTQEPLTENEALTEAQEMINGTKRTTARDLIEGEARPGDPGYREGDAGPR